MGSDKTKIENAIIDKLESLYWKDYKKTDEMKCFIDAVATAVGLAVTDEINTTLLKSKVMGTCPPGTAGGPLTGGNIVLPKQ